MRNVSHHFPQSKVKLCGVKSRPHACILLLCLTDGACVCGRGQSGNGILGGVLARTYRQKSGDCKPL